MKYILVTDQFIRENASDVGGWSKMQLHQLGVSWPPEKGWKEKIINTAISEEKAALFIGYGVLHRKNKK